MSINGKNTIIRTIYRPMINATNFEIEFSRVLKKNDTEDELCFLIGDLNVDLLKYGCNDYASRLFEQLSSSHFDSTIYKPTRTTPNSATLIDNIFTDGIDKDYAAGLLFNYRSDHLPIFHILHGKANSIHSRIDSVVKRVIKKSNNLLRNCKPN